MSVCGWCGSNHSVDGKICEEAAASMKVHDERTSKSELQKFENELRQLNELNEEYQQVLFEYDDVEIVNLFVDETGRYDVVPWEHYGWENIMNAILVLKLLPNGDE